MPPCDGHLAWLISRHCGRPAAFSIAAGVIAVRIVTRPVFGVSDTWQRVINTGATIFAFHLVCPVRNTQNRDTEAIPIKRDELIRAARGAHNALMDPEELEEAHLARLRARPGRLAGPALRRLLDTDTQET